MNKTKLNKIIIIMKIKFIYSNIKPNDQISILESYVSSTTISGASDKLENKI